MFRGYKYKHISYDPVSSNAYEKTGRKHTKVLTKIATGGRNLYTILYIYVYMHYVL